MTPSDCTDVWVLLGHHRGDNDQLLALAEGLGVPYRPIQMHYRWFSNPAAWLRRITIAHLRPQARREIAPPWPSLVLGIGQRSVPVARYIKRSSGGEAIIVRLGNPSVPPRLFDLVIATRQYPVPDADNVVRLPVVITNDGVEATAAEERWLEGLARPRRLVIVGGATSLWRLQPRIITRAVDSLQRRAAQDGGSIIAVTSPRTSPGLVAAAETALGKEVVITGPFPRYRVLLSAADEIHVTGDSVSMLSEAVASGKPVGLIPLEPSPLGQLVRLGGAILRRPLRLRHLEHFWDYLIDCGLIGTIEQPRRGTLDALPIETAVAAIRAAMDGGLPETIVPLSVPNHRAGTPPESIAV